jgi:hypothetical protein
VKDGVAETQSRQGGKRWHEGSTRAETTGGRTG